ncbi:hypothetical protein BC834DRAFT_959728 [Gloeopeniophorella convolvens]|nr:hypothetical protein BC834DRAFT_959728 [Gloeopeniophorella convolvens]
MRASYIRAFIAHSFKGATCEAVRFMLEGSYQLLLSGQRQSDEVHFPGLENFALTLRMVERRLQVNTDDLIKYYYLCPRCWHLYTRAEILESESSVCSRAGCPGILYTSKRLRDGTLKRTPKKLLSYVSPISAIRLMLSRPGKYEQLQHWRTHDDAPGHVAPSQDREDEVMLRRHTPMRDIYDGWGWRAIQAGLERRRTNQWNVEDVDVHELQQRFVSLPCGLVFQLNLDWFQSVKNSTHSTGALYMTCLNNPRSVRYLREETQYWQLRL